MVRLWISGYYCLASAIALWGEPRDASSVANLLEAGRCARRRGYGYGDFGVTHTAFKVGFDSVLWPVKFRAEGISWSLKSAVECQKGVFAPRG